MGECDRLVLVLLVPVLAEEEERKVDFRTFEGFNRLPSTERRLNWFSPLYVQVGSLFRKKWND